MTSEDWKIVIGVRRARNEDKMVVRCAPITRSPSSQVHVVDKDWLFDVKNVEKEVFGFIGGGQIFVGQTHSRGQGHSDGQRGTSRSDVQRPLQPI